jgi:hypothetical protein
MPGGSIFRRLEEPLKEKIPHRRAAERKNPAIVIPAARRAAERKNPAIVIPAARRAAERIIPARSA